MDQPLVVREIFEDPSVFATGKSIRGRFRITRLLARGGMGEVDETMDLKPGHVYTRKSRVIQEVQLARRIVSPYVCRALPGSRFQSAAEGVEIPKAADGCTGVIHAGLAC
jgi:hypothetical protein